MVGRVDPHFKREFLVFFGGFSDFCGVGTHRPACPRSMARLLCGLVLSESPVSAAGPNRTHAVNRRDTDENQAADESINSSNVESGRKRLDSYFISQVRIRAGDRVRTDDNNVGNVVLYQLSYARLANRLSKTLDYIFPPSACNPGKPYRSATRLHILSPQRTLVTVKPATRIGRLRVPNNRNSGLFAGFDFILILLSQLTSSDGICTSDA